MKTIEQNIQQKLDQGISDVITQSGVDKAFWPSKVDRTYTGFLQNKFLVMQIIREGIPYSLFTLIQDYTPFSEKDWSEFLDISTKSLQRLKITPKNFKPIHSEKIIELAEVTNVGLDVFGNMEQFKSWLNTPNFALGSLKPIDLLRDSYGKEMVISELTRINYGILV